VNLGGEGLSKRVLRAGRTEKGLRSRGKGPSPLRIGECPGTNRKTNDRAPAETVRLVRRKYRDLIIQNDPFRFGEKWGNEGEGSEGGRVSREKFLFNGRDGNTLYESHPPGPLRGKGG